MPPCGSKLRPHSLHVSALAIAPRIEFLVIWPPVAPCRPAQAHGDAPPPRPRAAGCRNCTSACCRGAGPADAGGVCAREQGVQVHCRDEKALPPPPAVPPMRAPGVRRGGCGGGGKTGGGGGSPACPQSIRGRSKGANFGQNRLAGAAWFFCAWPRGGMLAQDSPGFMSKRVGTRPPSPPAPLQGSGAAPPRLEDGISESPARPIFSQNPTASRSEPASTGRHPASRAILPARPAAQDAACLPVPFLSCLLSAARRAIARAGTGPYSSMPKSACRSLPVCSVPASCARQPRPRRRPGTSAPSPAADRMAPQRRGIRQTRAFCAQDPRAPPACRPLP